MDRRLITLSVIATFSIGAGFARLPESPSEAPTAPEVSPEVSPEPVAPTALDVLEGIEPWITLGPGPTCALVLNHYADGTSLTTLVNTIQYAWSFETFAVADCLEAGGAPTLLVGAAIPLIHVDPLQGACDYTDALEGDVEDWSGCEALLPALIERARADRVVLKTMAPQPPQEPKVIEQPIRVLSQPYLAPTICDPDFRDAELSTNRETL